MAEDPRVEIYLLHVWLRQINPMIWRRILVRSDSTITNLHDTLQIAFGWSDEHLNRFHIHGQDYGVYHDGGLGFSTDPDQVRLSNFRFRINERFLYEYDFGDGWQHEVRVEERRAPDDKYTYPCCIGGQRRAPPEKCGGPWAFMARRDVLPQQVADLYEQIQDDIEANGLEAILDLAEDIEDLHEWLTLNRFDRRTVNDRLKRYAKNDEAWKKGDCHEDSNTGGD